MCYDTAMAKRRTKKDKVAAKHTYQLGSWYDPHSKAKGNTEKETPVRIAPNRPGVGLTAEALYGYDPKLIISDLMRTVVVSMVVLVAELGLYFWRY